MRPVTFLTCALLLMFHNICCAEVCPGPNTQTIRDAHFHFTYESWVKRPDVVNSVFSYGRCVEVANQQSMDVDWDKPQLKGLAAPDQPILITLPFALDNRVSTASDLGWGIE